MGKKSGVLVLVLLAAAATVYFFYPRYKERERRVETAKQALNIIRQNVTESNALAALGDINIDPAGLTLAKLNGLLQRPPHEISAHPNPKTILMGWACGGDLCSVKAFFLTQGSGPVPLSAAPIELWISNNTGFGKPFPGSIGGIHLGDTTEKLIAICAKNGYKIRSGTNRISWDKDWEVRWTAKDDRITSLFFFNMMLINSAIGELQPGTQAAEPK